MLKRIFLFQHGIHEKREINNNFKSNIPENANKDFIANDIKTKSVMTVHKTKKKDLLKFNESFLYTKLGFTRTEYSIGSYTKLVIILWNWLNSIKT